MYLIALKLRIHECKIYIITEISPEQDVESDSTKSLPSSKIMDVTNLSYFYDIKTNEVGK